MNHSRAGSPAVRGQAPWWIRVSGRIIRQLPAGRFRAAAFVARAGAEPFVARMAEPHGGASFWCDLGDAIARDVCLIGDYEPQVTRAVSALLTPGMVVIDTGANWGYFTLLAARLVGPTGRVVALEPDPRVFDLLQRNLSLNDFPQVTALALAAGRTAGTLTLDGYDEGAGNRGVSRIRAGSAAPSGTTFTVASAPMDEVTSERGIEAVDLIKIDVEGAEDAVLAGMERGLAQGRYRRILVELHPQLLAERGITADECCEVLRRAGYSGWAFDHSAAAVRQAAYARSLPLSALLRRTDHVPPDDPWPHMLWTAAGVGTPSIGSGVQ